MPNKNYLKGVRFERKLVNEARNKGLIAFRSAGSHSPIDVVIIDTIKGYIELIQCKKAKSYDKSKYSNNKIKEYLVSFMIQEEVPDLRIKKKKKKIIKNSSIFARLS